MNRRSLLIGLGSALAAPAIVKAENIMRVVVPTYQWTKRIGSILIVAEHGLRPTEMWMLDRWEQDINLKAGSINYAPVFRTIDEARRAALPGSNILIAPDYISPKAA